MILKLSLIQWAWCWWGRLALNGLLITDEAGNHWGLGEEWGNGGQSTGWESNNLFMPTLCILLPIDWNVHIRRLNIQTFLCSKTKFLFMFQFLSLTLHMEKNMKLYYVLDAATGWPASSAKLTGLSSTKQTSTKPPLASIIWTSMEIHADLI